ncbi:methyltransferase-like protein 27 [Clytia hemisphaerica]|uniref:Methyltransferase domain-containing protein n=1 Tax=Clytia hemisphaerica TaxID=252671 RepID=A0A7M5WTJ2_9CNID
MATTLTSSSFFGGLDKTRNDIDKVVEYYDHHANNYNACLHNSRYTETTDYCADLLKRTLGVNFQECEILDLGCGSGKTGASLLKLGFQKIDGIDPSTEMLEVAKEMGCYRNLVAGKLTAEERLPYADNSFDGILCAGCFTVGHIEVKDGIPELLRVLRTGGVAVYTISFTLEKGKVMQEHAPYVTGNEMEIQSIEKHFYHMIGENPVYCQIYCIKKL